MNTPENTRPGQVTQVPVTHEIRRTHDDSVISVHCCQPCAGFAFGQLHLADMMGGDNQPGPLEYVEARIVEVATGDWTLATRELVPLDGIRPVKPQPAPYVYDGYM